MFVIQPKSRRREQQKARDTPKPAPTVKTSKPARARAGRITRGNLRSRAEVTDDSESEIDKSEDKPEAIDDAVKPEVKETEVESVAPSTRTKPTAASRRQSNKLRSSRRLSPADAEAGDDDDLSGPVAQPLPPAVTSARRRSQRSRTQSPVTGASTNTTTTSHRRTQNSNKPVSADVGTDNDDDVDDDIVDKDEGTMPPKSSQSNVKPSPPSTPKTRLKKRSRATTPDDNDDDETSTSERKTARISHRGTPTPRKRSAAGECVIVLSPPLQPLLYLYV